MTYTCFMTVFAVKDLEALKASVKGVSNYFVSSGQTLSPAKWVFRNKKHWPMLKKAAFVFYTTNHPQYVNNNLKSIKNEYYGTK